MLRVLLVAVCAAAVVAGAALPTLDGRRVDPLAGTKAKAVVLLFTRSDCPISNRYAPEVERLYERFGSRGFDFWLVYVDPSEPEDSIRKHVREFGYKFDVLLDRRHELVKAAQVSVTPEVAVYSGGRLLYRGRIDDRYVGFGKSRQTASEHDLEDVLEAIASGRPLQPRTTHAVGCFIEDLSSSSAPPTFNKDVAPIVFNNCAPCHRPGESAPFSLLTYSDAKKRATQIAAVTASRYMPPWLPEHGKGEFAGERRLTDAQIATIRQWADGGAPEGDPADLPAAPKFVEDWQLGRPDLVVTLDKPYTLAASSSDVFRNFVLRPGVDHTRYVRAIEIRPGNKRIVHHANVLIDRSGSSRLRDGQDGAPGFPGMDLNIESDTFDPESHFLFWKPGTSYSEEPPDMAWRLDPGTDLVLNMHLQPSGKPESLQPSIGLYFTGRVSTKLPMLVQLEHDGALDIPAGDKAFVVTDSLKLPVDVDLLGVYPHAHYIGKDLQGMATLPDGSKRWLIHIPDWDINWQAVYRYKQPVFLPKGTVLSMRYTYDNSPGNPRNPSHPPHRVKNGDRSEDEMAHLWLQLLPRGGPDGRMVIQEAVMRRRLEKYPSDLLAEYSLGSLAQQRGKLDEAVQYYRAALKSRPDHATIHNALGAALLASSKPEEAFAEFQTALRLQPDYANAHYNIARLLLASDRLDDAIGHLRAVLRVNPRDVPALSDLGGALLATGKTEESIKLLREAIRLQPDYFNARYNLGQALEADGKPREAAEEYRAALRIDPNDADTRAAIAKLQKQ
jgi:Tfp pilus assembly protein PilF